MSENIFEAASKLEFNLEDMQKLSDAYSQLKHKHWQLKELYTVKKAVINNAQQDEIAILKRTISKLEDKLVDSEKNIIETRRKNKRTIEELKKYNDNLVAKLSKIPKGDVDALLFVVKQLETKFAENEVKKSSIKEKNLLITELRLEIAELKQKLKKNTSVKKDTLINQLKELLNETTN